LLRVRVFVLLFVRDRVGERVRVCIAGRREGRSMEGERGGG
jgi:hypothetical protein